MKNNINKSVAVFSNYFWTVYNFRKPLILELIKNGYKVTAIASDDEYTERTRQLGCDVLVIKNLDPKSSGVVKEFKLVWEIMQKLRKLDGEYIYTFTIKPNLFTSITRLFTGKKTILTINGRGNFFTEKDGSSFFHQLYRLAFKNASRIFFQNRDDFDYFHSRQMLDPSKVIMVRGSGVDLQKFSFAKRPFVAGNKMTFLMACRLLREKGIFEYLHAAEQVKNQYPEVQFRLLGVTAINPSAVSPEELLPFAQRGIIEPLAKTDDMNQLLEEVDVLVLPSYYSEGIPKILLEGLSKGLPIITSNWVGCKETVDNNVNGFLIEPKTVEALVEAMKKMIMLNENQRMAMRTASRRKAEQEFDEKNVLDKYLQAIEPGLTASRS